MNQPNEFARRLAAVEADLIQMRNDLRQQSLALRGTEVDTRAARTLAAGADRDVSEFRQEMQAHTRALNALRETQREEFSALSARMDDGFAEVRAGFARLADMLGQLGAQRPDAEDDDELGTK